MIKKISKEGWQLSAVILFYGVIGSLVILSGDDWAWGGPEGLARLANKFDLYNGRYVGNLIELVITRNFFLRIILYSIVNTSIIYLLWRLLEKKIPIPYLFFVILTIPIGVYAQTYGWIAGFSNYNISILVTLWCLVLIKTEKTTPLNCLLLGILGVIGQLFAENMTILNMFLSAIILIYYLIIKKKLVKPLIWLVTTLSGSIIMFTNSAYSNDTARGVSNISLLDMLPRLLNQWSELVFKNNVLLIIGFSVCLLLLNKSRISQILATFVSTYFVVRKYLHVSFADLPKYILYFELLLLVVFIIFLTVSVSKSKLPTTQKTLFYFYFMAAAASVAPFLLLSPFGPRTILAEYLFLILAIGTVISHSEVELTSKLTKIISGLCVSLALVMIGLQGVNRLEEVRREAHIQSELAAGAEEVHLRVLPFEMIGHDLTPQINPVQMKRQKRHYQIPEDVKIKIVPRIYKFPR